MVDIRDHGGVFGAGGYKPNSNIPSWKLSPMVQDIGGFPRKTAYGSNNNRPVIKYDKSTDQIYFGDGALEVYTKGGQYVNRLSVGSIQVNEILFANNLVFTMANGIYKTDKQLTNWSQLGISAARGMILWDDGKLYVLDKSNNRVFPIITTDPVGTINYGTIITLSGVVGSVNSFTRDANYFYIGNNAGQIQVFDLTGKLINTFNVISSAIGPLYLRNGFIYFTSGKTLYKINASTGSINWSLSLNSNDGSLSGELAFEDKYIFAPASSTPANILVVKDATGETVYSGYVARQSYQSNDSKNLYGIDIVDSVAYMTHMMSSDSYGYYFNVVMWPHQLKVVR